MKNALLVLWAALVISSTLIAFSEHRTFGRAPGRVYVLPPKIEYVYISGKLHGDNKEEPKIHPAGVYVDRGARTLWTNGSDTPILIRFGKGAKCRVVSRFELLNYQWAVLAGCIVTEPAVPSKSIVETTFTEGAVIPYEIEFVGTGRKLTGTIKVF
jgi:hypothetical protein